MLGKSGSFVFVLILFFVHYSCSPKSASPPSTRATVGSDAQMMFLGTMTEGRANEQDHHNLFKSTSNSLPHAKSVADTHRDSGL